MYWQVPVAVAIALALLAAFVLTAPLWAVVLRAAYVTARASLAAAARILRGGKEQEP